MAGGEGRRFAELLGASALALGHPLLDVFGRSTETFVFRGIDGRGYVLFAVTVVVAPPVLLWAGGSLIGRLTPAGRDRVHIATMAVLVAIATLVAVRWVTDLRGGTATAVAIAGAVAVALAYARPAVPRFFRYMAVLPAVALVGFIVNAPASALLRGGEVQIVDDASAERPVVMLVLDEFPTVSLLDERGAVDPIRFPSLARMAREGAWYRNHTTLSASTVRAVPSLLTGDVPDVDHEPVWSDQPDNLFTLLGGSHELRVRETVTRLCPPSLCAATADLTRSSPTGASGLSGLGRDAMAVLSQLVDPRSSPRVEVDAFEEEVVRLDPVAEATEVDGTATAQPARFADFVTDLVDSDEAVLHFLHLILPHGPWRFTQDGTEYEPPETEPPGQIGGIWTDPWPAAVTEVRLELQARYTDLLVGRVIERLETTGLWDTATIVLVADHGGSFMVGERGRALTDANASEVMWAPLFIRSPELQPGPTDVNAQAIDVLPTIAELVGVTPPFDTDGRSLVRRRDGALAPVDGVGGTSGVKQYARFTNAFQPGSDAVLDIEIDRELPRVLAAGRAVTPADATDPIGAFHRSTPHGDLYGAPVSTLDMGRPTAATVRLDQREPLEEGAGDGAIPMYVGGTVDGPEAEAEQDLWVVIAVDGEVAALSPTFEAANGDREIATIIDPAALDRSGNDITAYLISGTGGPLRPSPLS